VPDDAYAFEAEYEEALMATKLLTADLPEELANKVDELAAKLDRPRASIVTEALSNWVELEEEHHRMTLEGLADARAGRLIDDAEVAAWIERLEADPTLPPPMPRQ
jgi:predicted transcriptional regulator